MKYDLKSVVRNFQVEGVYLNANPYGSGHINDTFLVEMENETGRNYILQRINHHIFKNVPKLMENIERVTAYSRKKLLEAPGSNPDRETLTLIPTVNGKAYYQDIEGNYWRIYIFIDHTESYDIVDSEDKAYEGGKAFGKFQSLLAGFPGEPLFETIPDFHNTEKRLQTFYKTIERDPVKRAHEVSKEIEFVKARAEEMTMVVRMGREGKICKRVTHNDTKFNNVLLDENGKAVCIIDLDTVMPGYSLYDFGDSIRTATNTAAEDEKDLSKVSMNISIFEAYARGFLEQTRHFLTETEIANLAFGGKLLTFLIGLRFLTDYIDGDHYFKIHFPEHNLQRARAQFKLLASMEEQFDNMKDVINRIMSGMK